MSKRKGEGGREQGKGGRKEGREGVRKVGRNEGERESGARG